MNDTQQAVIREHVNKQLDSIYSHALKLRHINCTYTHPNPFEGKNDGKEPAGEWQCDCKTLLDTHLVPHPNAKGENSGCIEALFIMRLTKTLRELI